MRSEDVICVDEGEDQESEQLASETHESQNKIDQDCSESILAEIDPFAFDEAYPCMMPVVQNIDLIQEPVLSETQTVGSSQLQLPDQGQ